jgi:NADPH-dependent curcumin reductase CurA
LLLPAPPPTHPPTRGSPPRYVDAGPVPEDAFKVENTTLATDQLPEGAVVAETLYLSVDPCARPEAEA